MCNKVVVFLPFITVSIFMLLGAFRTRSYYYSLISMSQVYKSSSISACLLAQGSSLFELVEVEITMAIYISSILRFSSCTTFFVLILFMQRIKGFAWGRGYNIIAVASSLDKCTFSTVPISVDTLVSKQIPYSFRFLNQLHTNMHEWNDIDY